MIYIIIEKIIINKYNCIFKILNQKFTSDICNIIIKYVNI